MPALLLLVISGALPFRVWSSIGPFRSFSVLDIAVVAIGLHLCVRALRGRSISVGDPWVFLWLCVLPAVAALSVLWTTSIQETLRSVVVYGEALTAYACVCTGLADRGPKVAMGVATLFVALLILAA